MSDISLSEAIQNLRSELAKAQRDAEPTGLRFDMREIELDLQIVANKETKVTGQVAGSGSLWQLVTVKIDGNASRSSRQDHTHRIKLKMGLAPDKDGKPQTVGDYDDPPTD